MLSLNVGPRQRNHALVICNSIGGESLESGGDRRERSWEGLHGAFAVSLPSVRVVKCCFVELICYPIMRPTFRQYYSFPITLMPAMQTKTSGESFPLEHVGRLKGP